MSTVPLQPCLLFTFNWDCNPLYRQNRTRTIAKWVSTCWNAVYDPLFAKSWPAIQCWVLVWPALRPLVTEIDSRPDPITFIICSSRWTPKRWVLWFTMSNIECSSPEDPLSREIPPKSSCGGGNEIQCNFIQTELRWEILGHCVCDAIWLHDECQGHSTVTGGWMDGRGPRTIGWRELFEYIK